MNIERRRHFRFHVRLSARLRPPEGGAGPAVDARVADLSLGGARLALERAPDWPLDRLISGKLRPSLDLEIPGQPARWACPLKVVRVVSGGSGCELGVQFAGLGGEERRRLARYLEHVRDHECGDEVARLYRKHTRSRRRQRVAVLVLAAVTCAALGFVVFNLWEAFPDWAERARSLVRSEARQAAREAAQEEARRSRGAPHNELPPEERRRLEDARDR